jgi:hypothetical protein
MNHPKSLPAKTVTAIKKICLKEKTRVPKTLMAGLKMIEHYKTGSHMIVDGHIYHQDLKIIRGQVTDNWWRLQGHRLDPDDIKDVVHARPKILVVGTGYAGNMHVPDITRNALSKHNIDIVAEITSNATNTYNQLFSEGEDVAGAFHLTC